MFAANPAESKAGKKKATRNTDTHIKAGGKAARIKEEGNAGETGSCNPCGVHAFGLWCGIRSSETIVFLEAFEASGGGRKAAHPGPHPFCYLRQHALLESLTLQ